MEIYGRKCGSNCNISTRCWIGARTSWDLIKLADEPFDGTPSVNTLGKVIDFTMELFSRGIGRTALFYGVNGGMCSHPPLQI